MSKRISFSYYNGFDGSSLGSAVLPYDRVKAKDGFYSRWWRIWRKGLSNIYGLDKHWVRAKINLQ